MPIQALRANEPIAGYTVRERIGAGGYGEVWKAEAPGGLAKAIKFVYGHLDEDRAARELKALNRIKEVRHPFLLSLERIEVIEGRLVIVTELAESSLKDRFERCTRSGLNGIPRDELLMYLQDAADALDYLSEHHSLQHLDVKPENLLLVGGHVKVADFGLVKHLHDVTASLMGGLTPLYAPPEVFDGRPSRHSDQYSLAIVYQEMLTGTLPFLGTTAAQLATQHLQGQPCLSPLPAQDQQTVARALAKNPEDRFASCREMVEHLMHPERSTPRPVGPTESWPPDRRGGSVGSAAATAQYAGSRGSQARRAPPPRRAGEPAIRGALQSPGDKKRGAGPLPPLQPPPPVTHAQPLSVRPAEAYLRPTFLLGLGGTAARVFVRLRRRLQDRLGDAAAVPALQMLLVDTDYKALVQAAQGQDGAGLDPADTIALPLRRPQEYRTSCKELTQSLSRRWLYNIPRSLRTEGLRPLGRLALIDHAAQLLDRLQQGIAAAVRPEAIQASAKKTGLKVRADVPHIVLVASISGGTGSGMLLAAAYALRAVLAELGLSDADLCGLLTHSTGRTASGNDLAVANAYACLCELAHFTQGDRSFPGDPACGLPAFGRGVAPFEHTYVLYLGDDLTEQQYEARMDQLAEYLYLDTVTPSAALLDRCRRADAAPGGGDAPGAAVRTFGLCQVGLATEEVLATGSDALCRTVVQRWLGEPAQDAGSSSSSSTTTSSLSLTKTKIDPPELEQINCWADAEAGKLGLGVEALADNVYQIVCSQLAPDLNEAIQRTIAQLAAESNPEKLHADVLCRIDMMLGIRDDDRSLREATVTTLPPEAASQIKQMSAELGRAIADRLFQLLDRSEHHLCGARQAGRWFDAHLDRLREESFEVERRIDAEISELYACLIQYDSEQRARRGSGQDAPPGRQLAPEALAPLAQYFRLRVFQLALNGTRKLLLLLRGQIAETVQRLDDLRREFSRLLVGFAAPASAAEPGASGGPKGPSQELSLLAVQRLSHRMPELAEQLDRRFREQFAAPEQALRALATDDANPPGWIAALLRRAARQVILASQQREDIAELLLPAEEQPETTMRRLARCIKTATPQLHACGGVKRLLLLAPEGSSYERLQTILTRGLEEPVSVGLNRGGDVVLCYEMQQIPIAQVAAALLGNRRDCAEIAARLQTRTDIRWSPWS